MLALTGGLLVSLVGAPSAEGLAATGTGVRCAAPADAPVTDGQPIQVSLSGRAFVVGAIPAGWWTAPPVSDPSWQMHFRGLMWMPALAQRAYDDQQQQSLDALVQQVVTFEQQDPDPGTSAAGWDEGTSLRRLQALTCVYALTQDQRLVPSMRSAAAVLLGPRYYGPPYRPVHNHGLMANLFLVQAADALGVPSWKSQALARLAHEAPLAFSPSGVTWEQSSEYQQALISMWSNARDVLEASPGTEGTVAMLTTSLQRARTALSWMTEPDGDLVQIGDSDQVPGLPGSPTWRPGAFRDPSAGWVMGRWSWSDPKTTYYTVRFGPARRAHGHQDRGGVTFTTSGVRVLVGAGRFDYDARSPWNAYQLSAAAQNTAVSTTGRLNTRATVSLASSKVQSRAHAWLLRDSLYGRAHSRDVNVNAATRTMRVTDTFAGSAAFLQNWTLDPAWRLKRSSATSLTFTHPSGRTLTVSTTGRVSALPHGLTRPIAGWHFPTFRSRQQAYTIIIRGSAKVVTSFTVR